MPRKANDSARAGAVEGVRWYFSDERPSGPPGKPFLITYTGSDVVSVPGVGLFQNGTTAEASAKLAERLRGEPDWVVAPRPARKRPDEEATEDAP